MKHSRFQTAAFNWLKDPAGSAVMPACAGAGKTYMIESMSRMLNPDYSQVMVPFNKHIAQELVRRGLPAFTLNAFGYGILRTTGWRIAFERGFKTMNLLRSYYNTENMVESGKFFKMKNFVQRVVTLAKANCIFTLDVLDEKYEWIVKHYALEEPDLPQEEIIHCVYTIYDWALNDDYHIDFDDQIFKVLQHGLRVPKHDFVFIDEVQDMTPANIELYLRMIHPRGHGIAVGDDEQSIYRFRGAQEQTLEKLQVRQSAATLPLSICYRCGTDIVENASQFVPEGHILPWEGAGKGYVGRTDEDDFRSKVRPGDNVLCRCTAPLVKECLRNIKLGVPAYVAGKDIGDTLVTLLRKPADNRMDADIPSALARLKDWFTGESARLERLGREETLANLQDQVEAVEYLTEGCRTVEDFSKKMETVFKDNGDGIIYRTIHRSKGLESDRIWSIGIDKLPHKKGHPPEERRLQYVEATRAKKEHIYVESSTRHKMDDSA